MNALDRTAVHDLRNELAVAIGKVQAFADGLLQPTPGNLHDVLAALESANALLSAAASDKHGAEPSEKLLRLIVEGSPFAKLLVDEFGTMILVNAQTELLFGYDREELLGRHVEMLVPEHIRHGHEKLREHFAAAPAARPMGSGRDLFGRRKDGTQTPIEIGLNPLVLDGRTFILAAIADISDRKRAEAYDRARQQAEYLEQLNGELAEASRFKTQFVATMSHELRTPLTAIIGASELLDGIEMSERGRTSVRTIAESSEALLALIGSILDYSKIEAGKLELRTAPLTIDTAVERAAEMLAVIASKKGILLHTYVDPLIPPVIADADNLRQILLNLIGNAIKFTETGHVVARVLPAEISADRVTLRFEVQDTGIGIEPHVIPKLFEPFSQADTSPSRRHGGSGLGLSISKRLVALMGGEIGVQSDTGKGSLFWFTVPFVRAQDAAVRRTLDGVAALIVSDDGVFAEIIASYLNSWSMTCKRISTKDELTAALISGRPWIAILDESTHEPNTNAKLFSAVHEALPSRTIVIGRDGTLHKPVRQSYLFDAIVQTAERRHTSQSTHVVREARPALDGAPSILVAEDNHQLRSLLQLQFDELGIPVTFAGDGSEAIRLASEGKHAMIFMDCQMPVIDGLTATRTIRVGERANNTRIPIVAMTANAFAEDRESCLAAGMDDYLAKPVRLAELRAMVERWCPADPAGTSEHVVPPK